MIHAFAVVSRNRERHRHQAVLDEIALRVRAYQEDEIVALQQKDAARALQCRAAAGVLEELGRNVEQLVA